jgi:hypothetical protein
MGTADFAHAVDNAVESSMASENMQQYSLADGGDKPSHDGRVVELTANAGNNGKMRKSGSGFLKGLLRNKSSGNLTDASLEHREASGPPSENGSAYAYAPDNATDSSVPAKKKGMKKLLSLGRSKKKNGSSASLSEHAAEPETGTDVET